jgi:hypothetical protein
VGFLCGSCVSPRPVSSLVTSPLNAEMVESDDMGVVMHTQVPGPWVKCDKLRRCSLHCSERVTQRVWALSRLSRGASQSRSKVYFVHYLCTVYLSAVFSTSPTKEALHTGAPPNPRTLSLQCISMRLLHPRLLHGVTLPVLAHPLCDLRCSLRPTLARLTPAPTLRCSLARPLCGLRCSPGRHSPARRPPRRSPNQHPAGARLPSTGGRRWQ